MHVPLDRLTLSCVRIIAGQVTKSILQACNRHIIKFALLNTDEMTQILLLILNLHTMISCMDQLMGECFHVAKKCLFEDIKEVCSRRI